MSVSVIVELVDLGEGLVPCCGGEPIRAAAPGTEVPCILVFTGWPALGRALASCPDLAAMETVETIGDDDDAIETARQLGLGLIVDLHTDDRGEHAGVIILPGDQKPGEGGEAFDADPLIGP